ncbi:MAG: restriction endonuclease subunit S [Gammaproteobacteria bacterium]|nr:MAG: restriction endonuclease subunit S [Gammaproteobacteria bacterium]
MNYPRYPEYKPSGVEWLGEVPAHWVEMRLKNVASIRVSNVDKKAVEGQETVRLCNYVDVYYHDQITPDLEFMEATATPQQIEKFALRKGDVLITKDSETPDDIAVPSFVSSDLDGVVCGYHLALIRPEASVVEGAYLARALAALGVRDQFHSSANGITRFGLSFGDISGASVLVPPLDEQRAIAAFLDRETARIDALIARKQRLIELLAEKRTALISQAVTKGLNPDAPMKDSGVEWLGEIPAHWNTPPLYARYSVELGKMLNESRITGDHLVPYLRNVDVQWDVIRFDDLPGMDIPATEYQRYTIRKGDLLVCEGGEVGRAAIVGEINSVVGYQKALHRLRATSSSEAPRFMYYTLYWAANTGVFNVGGVSTIAHLTGEQLRRYRFPKPPVLEQYAIADHLDRQTLMLDAMRAKVESAIEKLKEYRAALIADAVTGKIDIRSFAKQREVA